MSFVADLAALTLALLIVLVLFLLAFVSRFGWWELIPKRYRSRLRQFIDRVYDRLTKKDWTWRRFVHWAKLLLIIGTLLLVLPSVLFATVFYFQPILAWLLFLLKYGVSELGKFGNLLGFDATTFVLYAVAQVVADIIVVLLGVAFYALVFIIFLGKVRRGPPKPPKSNLVIRAVQQPRTEGDVRHFTVMVFNNGDDSAIECKAFIDFDHISLRDFVDIPNIKVQYDAQSFSHTSFFKTEQIRIGLPWSDGPTHTFQSGETPERLKVLSVVPAKQGQSAHFVIPSLSAMRGANLNCAHYYGSIVVTQQHGFPAYASFKTWKSVKGEWEFELYPRYP
jgi:hypothetical protein